MPAGVGFEVSVSFFRSFWFWIITVSVLAVIIWQGAVRAFFSESVYPFENAGHWLKRQIGVRAAAAWEAGRTAVARDSLEHEVERLRVALAEAELMLTENADLREQLGYAARMKNRVIAAPVLAQGGALGLWAQIKIGKGSAAGIEEGAVAIVPEGVVGRVESVTPHTAVIVLVSDPTSRMACEVVLPEGSAPLRGVVYGRGGKRGDDPGLAMLYMADPLRLQFLPRDSVLPEGARVVTSGLGGLFPRGLDVGTVYSDALSEDGLYREAAVAPAVDAMALRHVYILQGGAHAR